MFVAFGKGSKVLKLDDSFENLKNRMEKSRYKNYLLCNDDGEMITAVQHGKILKGSNAVQFEIDFTLY